MAGFEIKHKKTKIMTKNFQKQEIDELLQVTVVSQLTNVPTHDHFELQPAPAAKFCFDLHPELRVAARKKAGNSNLLTFGR